jgi:hypothetical protein
MGSFGNFVFLVGWGFAWFRGNTEKCETVSLFSERGCVGDQPQERDGFHTRPISWTVVGERCCDWFR